MHRFALLIALLFSTQAPAHEFLQGGYLCNPQVWYSTCYMVRQREATGRVALDGWYKSADTLYVGSPKACIVPGSDTQLLFHAITIGNGRGPIGYSIWNGISHNNAEYASLMRRSPWGKRVYDYVNSQGWLDTPELHTLTGEQLIALGVPACRD